MKPPRSPTFCNSYRLFAGCLRAASPNCRRTGSLAGVWITTPRGWCSRSVTISVRLHRVGGVVRFVDLAEEAGAVV